MIYLDHNATSPLRPEVSALLRERYAELAPANPASVHGPGRLARRRLEAARARVAKVLGAEPKEILFTSSGSEGNALALRGGFLGRADKARTRVVVSAIEHPALLSAADGLTREGAEVVRVAPAPSGVVEARAMLAAIEPGAALCSLQWVNNETGVIQPVGEVARACRAAKVRFHCDAVQAAGKLPVSLRDCDADLLTLSGHKLGAPAGVGVLVVRRGVDVLPLVPGHQEGGRRGGTSAVVMAEAFALALEISQAEVERTGAQLEALREGFEGKLLAAFPDARINGGGAPRVGNTVNVTFPGADGEAILISLDLAQVAVSTGAACASGSLTPSHVLTAMGLTSAEAHGSLRFSFGAGTTRGELEKVLFLLVEHVPRSRS